MELSAHGRISIEVVGIGICHMLHPNLLAAKHVALKNEVWNNLNAVVEIV